MLKTKIKNKNSLSIYDILKTRGVEYDLFFTLDEEDKRDPFEFKNMYKAIDLIHNAYNNDSKICYIIDTDTDGITSFSIAYNYFKLIYPNKKIEYFMNKDKKHGIFLEEEKISNLNTGDTLIVFDAGSNDVDQCEKLINKGINVVIVDHHDIEFDSLLKIENLSNNDSYAIVSPQLEVFKCNLTGAGMAEKIIEAYDKEYNFHNSEMFYDLAAVGCIADMEQFSNEIAFYIDKGLSLNPENYLLNAMINANKFNIGDEMTAQDVSFSIAPSINALIRVGTIEERKLMIEAFITQKLLNVKSTKRGAKEGDIEELHQQVARIMNNVKARQKRQVDKAIQTADKFDDGNIIILLTIEDNKNFTGLIANKIAGETGRPCLVLWSKDDNYYTGSARCPLNINFKQFLLNSKLVDFAAGC